MGEVQHGQQYRVLTPKQVWEKKHPGKKYREARVFGQGSANDYYEFTTRDNGQEKVCRDYFGDILQASSHVAYPFGSDSNLRNVKYIEDNIDRFELIEEEEETT